MAGPAEFSGDVTFKGIGQNKEGTEENRHLGSLELTYVGLPGKGADLVCLLISSSSSPFSAVHYLVCSLGKGEDTCGNVFTRIQGDIKGTEWY